MSNTKFDLERFKAGEAAVEENGTENYFVQELTPGEVIIKWKDSMGYWCVCITPVSTMKEEWSMKPEEEWILLTSHVFGSKKEAEEYNSAHGLGYDVVRIVRD